MSESRTGLQLELIRWVNARSEEVGVEGGTKSAAEDVRLNSIVSTNSSPRACTKHRNFVII
jgi:hypothetical protein